MDIVVTSFALFGIGVAAVVFLYAISNIQKAIRWLRWG